MATAAASSGEADEETAGVQCVVWDGPWTEDRIVALMKEHEEKIKESADKVNMLQKVIQEFAIKTDQNSARITEIPVGAPGLGQPDVQDGNIDPGEFEMWKMRIREMDQRPRVDPMKFEDIEKTLNEVKENIEMMWRDPAPGMRRDEREPRKKSWDTRKLKLEPYGGDRKEFRSWVFSLKAFIRREAPGVESYMCQSEYSEEEITGRLVSDNGVDMDEDKELAWLLTNYTSGEIKDEEKNDDVCDDNYTLLTHFLFYLR